MEKQTPLSEIRERGLKQSQASHEKDWLQVPKPHGEKCHDPARLDKIVKAWRETWRPGTRPESSTRPAAASPEWTRRLGMLEQLEERQAELQRKLDARQAVGPERRPVRNPARLEKKPAQKAQASELAKEGQTKPEEDEPARVLVTSPQEGATATRFETKPATEVAAASKESWCGVS